MRDDHEASRLAASGRGEEPARTASAARRNVGDASGSTSAMGPVLRARCWRVAASGLGARGSAPAIDGCRRAARLPPGFARRTMRGSRERDERDAQHAMRAERQRDATRASSHPRRGGERSYERGRISHGLKAGTRQVRSGATPTLSRGAGTLYVVATPLGNLRDLTLRALDVLGSADVIAAEDTRVTGVLLRHYGIATRPMSLHAHNEAARADEIVGELRARTQRGAGERCRHARDQRSGRAARARGARRGLRRRADSRRLRRDRRGVGGGARRRALRVRGLPAAAARRAASCSRASRALPARWSIYEAPHRVRATVGRARARRSAASARWWSRARSRRNSRRSRGCRSPRRRPGSRPMRIASAASSC